MNISVSVITGAAQARIKALEAQIASLQGRLAAASSMGGVMGRQISSLSKFGNQLQWTGRQLQYNFTLPIALAGAAATNFAMDNEKAFTRIVKVYGDAGMAQQTLINETNALKKAFVELSNHYGVHQAEVLNIAADWAAAGASGVALARGVEQTLRVMVLGEMQAADATEALIAIQAQYNLSSTELIDTIAKLNVVENQTGISLQGLVQGFARAGGVAREAGIDTSHLAAMLAALTPAAGSAAQAGNALKTIISRLAAPTGEARDILDRMGIAVDDVAWKSANGSQKIEILAKKYHDLDGATKNVVSSTLASRYQINKFEALMDSVYKKVDKSAKTVGYYGRALDATANSEYYMAQAENELQAVLKSNPQKFKQIWVILENAMADVIIPLIPLILMAATTIKNLVEAFRGLPLEVQKAISLGLLFLALFGPLIRYIGSTMTLIGELGWFFAGLAKGVFSAIGAVLSLIKLPFGAVGAALGFMSGGFGKLVTGTGKATKAIFSFLSGLTLFRRVGPAFGLIISGMATGLVQIWSQALRRIGLVTGPALAAVQQIFLFWRIGMARTMTLIGAAMTLGWTAVVTASRWVGPVLISSWRTTWAALVALTKFGVTAMALRMRAGFTAMMAFFVNWRLKLIAGMAAMWAGIVAITKAGMTGLLGLVKKIPKLLASPWTIAIAAVIAILMLFRKQIAEAINNVIEYFQNLPAGVAEAFQPLVRLFHSIVNAVVRAFYSLPEGVQQAMRAVVNIVYQAAMAVYKLFSYLNPFAHHSPSLVENVTNGMAEVRRQFGTITSIAGPIKKAYQDIKRFGQLTAGFMANNDAASRASDRATIGKVSPGALAAYDALVKDLKVLTPMMNNLSYAVRDQEQVVNGLKDSLDAANDALDVAQKRLDALEKVAAAAQASLDEAQNRLRDFANTPIQGMKAMEDQIFNNEMAQKQLRLEMLKMDEAAGGIDQLREKMSALGGEIEMLRGEQASLREGGAGSEILSQYDKQIAGLEDQQKSIKDTASEYDKLSTELDKLQRQGEILDLEKSLKFDPLTKAIQDAADAMKEMPFDEIMAGVQQANADIAKYSDQVEKANSAVDAQKKVVDTLTAARDALQVRYDAESKKLDVLRDKYNQVQEAVQEITGALREMASAADESIKRAQDAAKGGSGGGGSGSPALDNFDGSLGGNFPDVGGAGGLGREGGLGDQSALIDQFTKDQAEKVQKMFSDFDIFGPIKTKWNQFTAWWTSNVNPAFAGLGSGLAQIWSGTLGKVDWTAPFKGVDWKGAFGNIKDIVKDAFDSAAKVGKNVWKLFADDLKQIWKTIKDKFKEAVDQIAPELEKFKKEVGPITESMKRLWPIVKLVAGIIGGILLLALKILVSILKNTVGPALDGVIAIIKGFIGIIRGWVEIITGLINGDFGRVWEGIKTVWKSTLDAVIGVIKAAGLVLWGIVKGLVEGIWNFFVWLKDVLVGHSVVPDMVRDIIDWIKGLPGKAWNALKDLGSKILEKVHQAWDWWKDANSKAWNTIWNWLKGLPGKAWDALKELAGKLKSRATEAWDSFKQAATDKWNGIVSWLKGLGSAAATAISNMVSLLKSKGREVMDNFKAGLEIVWGNVKSWFSGLGDKVKDAIGNTSKMLYQSGKNIVQGLIDGLKSMVKPLSGVGAAVAGAIKDNFPFSPAKRGPLSGRGNPIYSGRSIGRLLSKGLLEQSSTVESAAASIMKPVSRILGDASFGWDANVLKSPTITLLPGRVAHAEARLTAQEATKPTTSYGGGEATVKQYNFYGDLSFPNITSPDDADDFISNLEALAGDGGRG